METAQNSIECTGATLDASRARVVLLDFDGTLSLIRSGWVDVMVPMMVECLLQLKTGESEQDLTDTVGDYVGRLTGKQTIYQMIELAGQIRRRGGQPLEPLEYKHMYLNRLNDKIKDRVGGLRNGTFAPDELLVPGARRLLEALRGRDLKLYLASGTDQPYLREEARLLQIDSCFDGRIFGALDDYQTVFEENSHQQDHQRKRFRGRRVSGVWRRIRRDPKRQASRGRRRRCCHGRAALCPRRRDQAKAAFGRRSRLDHPELFRAR